ncbi:MAG: peptidoglycan-binding protein, partial [Maritimibacter sp.]|nr:peptidoglycan-binding protein [Maritimibacter sp.]
LSSPTLTYGTLADVSGLSGEPEISRLEIRAQDGDTGGPVIDQSGSVAGMLLASPSGDGRVLPTDVGFIAKGATLTDFLAANGVTAATAGFAGSMTPYELSGHAADLTVLVSCWD